MMVRVALKKLEVRSNHIFVQGTNTPVPDKDPLDQCDGHGTHVAVSLFLR